MYVCICPSICTYTHIYLIDIKYTPTLNKKPVSRTSIISTKIIYIYKPVSTVRIKIKSTVNNIFRT